MNRFSTTLCLLAAGMLLLTGCASSPRPSKSEQPLAEGQAHFVRYGVNKVYYFTLGEGSQTIVFVHGWAGNGGFWHEQVPALAGKARLIIMDLPGHGQSDKPLTNYTLDYFARAVVAVLNDARVDKAVLVGHSMGTPVICRVYAQAPEKVAALVAVDGILRRPEMTHEQVEQFVGPYRTPEYREHVVRFISSMFPNPGTAVLRDQVCAEVLQTPQHVMSSALDNMFDSNLPDWDPKQVTVPVLVLNANNPMWTADYQAYVRSLSPQTDYRVIAGAGHFLMLEKPAEFTAALLDMLQKSGLITGARSQSLSNR